MKPHYRFSVYMEDHSKDGDFANLVRDYFTYATIRTDNMGLYIGNYERAAVLEYITPNAVEGEGTCSRFSDAFCAKYNQECTMIVMDRVHMRMSHQ
jgi:hypothetical protein